MCELPQPSLFSHLVVKFCPPTFNSRISGICCKEFFSLSKVIFSVLSFFSFFLIPQLENKSAQKRKNLFKKENSKWLIAIFILIKRNHCEKATSYSLSLLAGIHVPSITTTDSVDWRMRTGFGPCWYFPRLFLFWKPGEGEMRTRHDEDNLSSRDFWEKNYNRYTTGRPWSSTMLRKHSWNELFQLSDHWLCEFLAFSMTKVTSIFVSTMPTMTFFSFWIFLMNQLWVISRWTRDIQWNVREWLWPWARSCALIKIFEITAADIAVILGLKN